MNPSAAINLMVVVSGLLVVAALMFAGRRFLPKQNALRNWAANFFKHRGPLETARLAGLVVLTVTLSALTLWYS